MLSQSKRGVVFWSVQSAQPLALRGSFKYYDQPDLTISSIDLPAEQLHSGLLHEIDNYRLLIFSWEKYDGDIVYDSAVEQILTLPSWDFDFSILPLKNSMRIILPNDDKSYEITFNGQSSGAEIDGLADGEVGTIGVTAHLGEQSLAKEKLGFSLPATDSVSLLPFQETFVEAISVDPLALPEIIKETLTHSSFLAPEQKIEVMASLIGLWAEYKKPADFVKRFTIWLKYENVGGSQPLTDEQKVFLLQESLKACYGLLDRKFRSMLEACRDYASRHHIDDECFAARKDSFHEIVSAITGGAQKNYPAFSVLEVFGT